MATLTNLLVVLSCFLTTLTLASTKKHNNTLSDIPSCNNIIPKMNTIDSCWRAKTNWASNRQSLADCAIGFGKDAIGGKIGAIYEVTDPSDDPVNPKPGTLRYGVIQTQPLWITFARDMGITLKNELMVNSHKTIDGRGEPRWRFQMGLALRYMAWATWLYMELAFMIVNRVRVPWWGVVLNMLDIVKTLKEMPLVY